MSVESRSFISHAKEFTLGVAGKATGFEAFDQTRRICKANGIKPMPTAFISTVMGVSGLTTPLIHPHVERLVLSSRFLPDSFFAKLLPDLFFSLGLLEFVFSGNATVAAETKAVYNVCAAVFLQSISTINSRRAKK